MEGDGQGGVFRKECVSSPKRTRDAAEGSAQSKTSTLWRHLWQLPIQNAEKHFLWHACHDSLPTRANLCSRKVLTDPSCPICAREPEMLFHTLWMCPAARDVWSEGGACFQKSSFAGPEFLQVVEGMISRCDRLEFIQFVGIARRLWLRRNDFIHSGLFTHPMVLFKQALQVTELFQTLTARRQTDWVSMAESSNTAWTAPLPSWFKANWDAGVDIKQGRVGSGAVLRDHQGKMWAARSQTRHGFLDPSVAEALGALLAVQLCMEMGIQQVQLEGDAKNVIMVVNSEASDESSKGQLPTDIRSSLRAISAWEMRYVRRGENKVAHAFARLAVNEDVQMVWFYNTPE
ncbi:uncharacterized protein LOC132185192 [Corylus avellana]|uniref:uncharacterized protein LOC132185192 n=1 Tax=Corylus avellana TaxID=13451 RepID=UPI00286BD575|nr:uncharacterized protein LOC132185192 [Corylus avellana]